MAYLHVSLIGLASLVTDVVGLLNTLSGHAQNLLKTERPSLETQYIQLALEYNRKQFQSWKDVWTADIKLLNLDDTVRPVWSLDGGANIQERLRSIEAECDGIQQDLKKLEKLKSRSTKRSTFTLKMSRHKDQPSVQAFCAPLRSKIDGVSRNVNVLLAISSISSRSTQYQERQQYSFPVLQPLESLRDLRESRVECQRFYDFCSEDPGARWLQLEMSGILISPKFEGCIEHLHSIRQQYRICYNTGGSEKSSGLLLQQCEPQKPEMPKSEKRRIVQDLESADEALSSNCETILSLGNKDDFSTSYFTVVRSKDGVNESSTTDTDSSKSTNFATLEPSQLSITDRMDFARIVSQYFLIFLGTSWAGHLSGASYSRSTNHTGRSKYKCHLDLKSTRSDDATIDITNAEQSFNLGVFLVRLSMDDPPSARDLRRIDVQAETVIRVQAIMGVQYRQACEFCLSKSHLSGWDSKADVLGNDLKISSGKPEAGIFVPDYNIETASVCSDSSWYMVDKSTNSSLTNVLRSLQYDLHEFHREVFSRLDEACKATLQTKDGEVHDRE